MISERGNIGGEIHSDTSLYTIEAYTEQLNEHLPQPIACIREFLIRIALTDKSYLNNRIRFFLI